MKKLKHFLTPGWILLFFGSLALANGFLSWYFVPRLSDLATLKKSVRDAKELVSHLQKLPIPDLEEGCDLLPESITVGRALAVIERAAKEAGIRSISFDTQKKQLDSEVPMVETRAQPGEPGAAKMGESQVVPKPKKLSCSLKVRGKFQSLLRFLGILESSKPLMHIVSLDASPSESGVKGVLKLQMFFYPSESKEKAGG